MCEPVSAENSDLSEAIRAFGLERREQAMMAVDAIEAQLAQFPPTEVPVEHLFTKGLYVRTVRIPAGTILTSKIHKTQHPFVIHSGEIAVWTKEAGAVVFAAPYMGVTEPDTRRILFARTDTVWSTFHPNPEDETDLEAIEQRLIQKHHNRLLEAMKEEQP